MKNIAIAGHATRGKEVINELLSLGATNPHKFNGLSTDCFYVIINGEIDGFKHDDLLKNVKWEKYTLESYLMAKGKDFEEDKNKILNYLDKIINTCNNEIEKFKKEMNTDFFKYFDRFAIAHLKTETKKREIMEVRKKIVIAPNMKEIELEINSEKDFWEGMIFNFRVPQTTNQMYNMRENYKPEIYSELINFFDDLLKGFKI